ncbi:3'-5' exonuclease [Edwardsiella tarda]|uniref:3'-5' exonuclease n=1 Tax=Edwardsiella tarda TaxID=636 RepID=UPI00351C3EDE
MKILSSHKATRDQLQIISRSTPGVVVIRGAAGSGKTTSALLRLTAVVHALSYRKNLSNDKKPIKALVLSFNRTLAGYIDGLISESRSKAQLPINIESNTFACWATKHLGNNLIDEKKKKQFLISNSTHLGYDEEFILDEIEYIRGRFKFDELNKYLTTERTGRGISPQVTRQTRIELIKIIRNYKEFLDKNKLDDWHTHCEKMANIPSLDYDIVVADETQDFSANQIRAIIAHLADDYYLTFVIDTIQRLYPRGFTWIETGLDMRKAAYFRLTENHRNTIEIAKFASSITDGITVDDDGSISDFTQNTRYGKKPIICIGDYPSQVDFAIKYITKHIDLTKESVAFLKPKGGMWFDFLKGKLTKSKLKYHNLTKERNWPGDSVNIALSTMNSAKGLEFDHIIIIGLSEGNTRHQGDENDESLIRLRRLLAMAVSRARESVIIGYKEDEKPDLIAYFNKDTYKEIKL